MGHRLSKIYTKTGDDGTTGLGDGQRVAKDSVRVEAYGTVDELNSAIGVLCAYESLPAEVATQLLEIQHDLFDLGGELSIPGVSMVSDDYVERLEQWLDGHNADLPPLKEFILPGGGVMAAACHVARTIARRAERCVVTLAAQDEINLCSQRYLNRLSDFLFVLARVLVRVDGGAEVLWQRKEAK